jgi:hypothetical protein
MPLTNTVKNQIAAQIDALYDAIVAGTAFNTNDWIHQSFGFSAGGRQYTVVALPAGSTANPEVVLRLKRLPL